MALTSDVDLPVAHVRAQVASAIDLVVHTARLRDAGGSVFRIAGVDDLGGAARVTRTWLSYSLINSATPVTLRRRWRCLERFGRSLGRGDDAALVSECRRAASASCFE